MEFVIFDALDADGLKRSQADVQRDFGGFNAAVADAVEDLRREVKAGGGSGYRSALFGVDGLIAVAIVRGVRARDVGRQRDVADLIECGEEIVHAMSGREADAALAEFGAGQDLSLKFVAIRLAEEQAFADADLASGTDQAFPVIGMGGELTGQQNFDASVGDIAGRRIMSAYGVSAGACAAAIDPGGEDAGIVENDEVTGAQQVREVAELAIGIVAGCTLQVQHAGAVPDTERGLGDELGGQIEMEIRNQHGVRL